MCEQSWICLPSCRAEHMICMVPAVTENGIQTKSTRSHAAIVCGGASKDDGTSVFVGRNNLSWGEAVRWHGGQVV